MNLVYYHPIALTKKHPFHKCINPLISVLDRTENQWPDFSYKNLFPMPQLFAKKDFIEICYHRIRDIVKNSDSITLLWSGGIDSTFILCLLIDMGIADQLVKENKFRIGLNADSIKENPRLYSSIIKEKYINIVVQSDQVLNNPSKFGTILTGEMADNLVGSLTMKSCVDYYNDFSVVHEPWEKRGVDWFVRNLSNEESKIVREFLENIVYCSPVEIISSHELFWYLNFNLKWQAVNFRIVSHCQDQKTGNELISRLVHFFNTIDFQEWSMADGHYFTGSSWSEYKMPMKKYIFNVTKDEDYFKYKTKHPSLPSLLRFKNTFDFIYKDNDKYYFSKEKL